MKAKRALASGVWMFQSIVIAILLAASAITSQAQSYSLSARNTSLNINVAGASPGLTNWQVNGVNQLNQQWYYYSVGSGPVNSIDTIGTFSSQYQNFGNTPFLNQTYSNSTIFVTTDYTLQSQPLGAPSAKLSTLIGVQNLSGTTQTFHFYIYSDFWLNSIMGNQNVLLSSSQPYQATQTGSTGQLIATITGISGGTADSVEEIAGLYDGLQFGLQNGNPAPNFSGGAHSAGPGNVTFGYEVDATLASGTAISFTELESVPEPSTMALIFSGMLVFGWYYCRILASFKKVVKKASL